MLDTRQLSWEKASVTGTIGDIPSVHKSFNYRIETVEVAHSYCLRITYTRGFNI